MTVGTIDLHSFEWVRKEKCLLESEKKKKTIYVHSDEGNTHNLLLSCFPIKLYRFVVNTYFDWRANNGEKIAPNNFSLKVFPLKLSGEMD